MEIKVKCGDITKIKKVDVIVNASNGCGIMGAGVARGIALAGGSDFCADVRKIAMDGGPKEAGTVFLSPPGLLSRNHIKAVIHAVTMKYPGSPTSYSVVDSCLAAIFKTMAANGFNSVAMPGLGTGIGNLDRSVIAYRMVDVAKIYSRDVDIRIVDLDEMFIKEAEEAVSRIKVAETPRKVAAKEVVHE